MTSRYRNLSLPSPAFAIALLGLLGCSVAGAQAARPALRLTEVQRISALEQDLSTVGLVTRGQDGTIWISQPEDGYIVAFNHNGVQLRTVGSIGEGPGEYRYFPTSLWVADSRIWFSDRFLRRLTELRTTGQVVQTISVITPDGLPPGANLLAGGPEHAWYSSILVRGESGRAGDKPILKYFSAALRGGSAAVVASYPFHDCSVSMQVSPTITSARAIPLCHRTHDAVSPQGKFFGVAQPLDESKDRAGFDLDQVSAAGTVSPTSRHLLVPSPVSGRVLDSLTTYIRAMGAKRLPQLSDKIIASNLIPRTYSPVVALTISSNGQAWVTTRSGRSGELGVLAIRPDGTEIGYTAIPPKSRVGWVGNGRILLVEEQESGLEDVVLYTVRGLRGGS